MTSPPAGVQLRLDELDEPLNQTIFVVVDLETTGGKPGSDAITEIGAVKIQGGKVLGDFATLVDPGRGIPIHITHITGITTAMVAEAPRISSVLPAFLEFARGAVLVAHNAPFDIGFLKAAALESATPWPAFRVLCTVKLARRVLTRDEAPSVRLSALAELFRVSTLPTHRALDDARATVDVLHGLIARVGNQGVHSLPELIDYLPAVTAAQRGKRHLADALPRRPGVYLFRGPSDEVLYVGTAVDLRRRVRTYFTGSETRGRIKEMVALAVRVDHVECAHALEAAVRELRLIAAHAPPYNRKSKQPYKAWWINLTAEAFPRLVVSRTATMDSLGPIRSRTAAADIADALATACGLRTCRAKIPAAGRHGEDCGALGPVGGCPAIAADQVPEDAAAYAPRAQLVLDVVRGRTDKPLRAARERVEALATAELFENAARLRDRLGALTAALGRSQRLGALAALDELVAARPDGAGGWEFAVLRCGRLAAAGCAVRGVAPMPVIEIIGKSAATVEPSPGPLRGGMAEELGLVASWLAGDGVRIVRGTAGYAEPARGAGAWRSWADRARAGRAAAEAHYPPRI
ncbi:DEDD exonuclease domain-containing protein [Tomitella biformata]|uniref:DEDD exonuclease domain-containing protein n=1 Tax=Tomitella biformata TaxID=630403 RepID=UPI001904D7B4|nr:DEDD exonuclease domain-containing protein [Tomitella biformata]